jgi:hypothetical protein
MGQFRQNFLRYYEYWPYWFIMNTDLHKVANWLYHASHKYLSPFHMNSIWATLICISLLLILSKFIKIQKMMLVIMCTTLWSTPMKILFLLYLFSGFFSMASVPDANHLQHWDSGECSFQFSFIYFVYSRQEMLYIYIYIYMGTYVCLTIAARVYIANLLYDFQ